MRAERHGPRGTVQTPPPAESSKERLGPVSSSGLEQPIEYYESGPDLFETAIEKQPRSVEEAKKTRQIEESHVTLRSDRIARERPLESEKRREFYDHPSLAPKVEVVVSERGRAPLESLSRPGPDAVSATGTERVAGDRRRAPFAPSAMEFEPKKRKAA